MTVTGRLTLFALMKPLRILRYRVHRATLPLRNVIPSLLPQMMLVPLGPAF